MAKFARSLLAVFCILSLQINVRVGADDLPLYNFTLGSLDPDMEEVGSSYHTTIIPLKLRVHTDALLHRFAVRLGPPKPGSVVRLQVWREIDINEYELRSTIELQNMVAGVNEVRLRWYITAGDYIGVTCSRYCPLLKDPSRNRVSKISMNDRLPKGDYTRDLHLNFTDPVLTDMLAIEVTLEANSLPPTTTEFIDSSTTAGIQTTDSIKSSKKREITTAVRVPVLRAQINETDLPWRTWLVIAFAVIIFLLAIVLGGVCGRAACRRKETVSRSTSPFDTLNGRGQRTSEIEADENERGGSPDRA